MSSRTPLPECCATCTVCGWVYCRDVNPSPCQHVEGERSGICGDCWPKGCDVCQDTVLPW